MANGLIDLNETGPCRVCKNPGKRARGSRDIEGLAARTGVFVTPTFYCDECVAAAAQRSLVAFSRVQRIKRPGGLPVGVTRFGDRSER